jgi:hypothetical protein
MPRPIPVVEGSSRPARLSRCCRRSHQSDAVATDEQQPWPISKGTSIGCEAREGGVTGGGFRGNITCGAAAAFPLTPDLTEVGQPALSRLVPRPCESGLRYKHCHGRLQG